MQSACQEALRNQELPFNVLLNALKVRRDLGAHPLFQVMLVHQNVPAQYASSGMDVEVIKLDYGSTKLDLNFWIEEINDRLVVTLHYSSALFDRPTARRLLSDYSRAAACVCDALDTPIADLSLFAEADPPAAVRPTPPNEDILTRFAEQVERRPQAPAVIGEDGALTYAELDAHANCIAHRLLAEGSSVEKPVALLTGRGCVTVVALLGILKAGAPYIPLDFAQPVVRHRAVMADADASLIVCDASTAEIAAQLGAVCIRIDHNKTAATSTPKSCGPGAVAYLIYTSGTTGNPKGVCVEHRNIVAYSNAIWDRMGLDARDLFASLSSIATDLGNTMIFPPLLNGGCVVMCPDEAIADPTLLVQFFERHPVACFKITPSHLHAILTSPRLLPSKLLVLGGEVATPALIERIRSFAPGLRILNHYGPTETTVGVLTYEVPIPWPGGQIPLGSELGYADVRVLDTAGRSVPTGVIGELYIGGPTLTRGYWRARALTEERFVTAADGTRLYRTGDLGKHLANGTFSFHGRADRQIKIRGYRVEPGEIEAVLEKHPAVAQVAVRASTDGRLICYVVALEPVEPVTLISFMRGTLPTAMIPSVIVLLKSFPRTAAGKIDHAALPEPPQLSIDPQSHPRDPLELELMHIWQEVLNLEAVGIHDSFFECGGHSLLAVKLMSQIKTHFGLELPLATLFTHDSVANLAVLLRRRLTVDSGPLVTIRSGVGQSPIAPSIACVHPAGGDVLCYYPLAQAFASTKLVYGLRARQSDGTPSIQDLARRYVDALPTDPAPMLLGWSMGALVAFEMARQWEIRTGTALRIAILDQLAPHPTNLPPRGESDAALMLAFAAKVSALVGADIGIGPDQLDGDLEANFLAAFQRHGLAPEDVQVDDFSRYLHLMLAHNHATGLYRPTAPYNGDVLVLRAEESLAVGGSQVVRSTDLGWQHWCSGKCTVVSVPGNHVTMMRAPNITRIAKALEQGWGLI
jgi:amino acid adenylation domain-containing protein